MSPLDGYRPMRFLHRRRAVSPPVLLITSLLLAGSGWAGTVEHPGVVPKDSECTSCHGEKINGKSVHSAVATSCRVCHVAMTRGDMTTMSLLMPKEKICSACHEEAPTLREHLSAVKGQCVECHDAHSSNRKLLLRMSGTTPLLNADKK